MGRRRGTAALGAAIAILGPILVLETQTVVANAAPDQGGAAAAARPDVVCSDEQLFGGSYHDVTVRPGTWCLIGNATLTGSLRAVGATSLGMYSNLRIVGDVTISRTTSFPSSTGQFGGGSANAICTSAIGGDLRISRSGPRAAWNIGATNYPPFVNFSNCIFSNYVGGDVRFNQNAGAPNEIGGNELGGDLGCRHNGPFTEGVLEPYARNRIVGRSLGECREMGVKGGAASFPGIYPVSVVDPAGGVQNRPESRARCVSRRKSTIALDPRLVHARVLVGKRPAEILRGPNLSAVLRLRPRGRPVEVTIAGLTHDQRIMRSVVREYRLCRGTSASHQPRASHG